MIPARQLWCQLERHAAAGVRVKRLALGSTSSYRCAIQIPLSIQHQPTFGKSPVCTSSEAIQDRHSAAGNFKYGPTSCRLRATRSSTFPGRAIEIAFAIEGYARQRE